VNIKQVDGKTFLVGEMESVKPIPTESLQPNQISQGLYKCSAMTKKILAYTISNLNMITWKGSTEVEYETIFDTTDFIRALGFQKTGKRQKELIREALIELQKSFIAIDTGDKYETFPWVTHSVYAEKEKKIAIELNHHLGQALMEMKKGYTVIELLELGKLQSFYAMRYYEIARSLIGFAGTKGNKRKEWFFDMQIQEIKTMFQLKEDEYAGRTNNLIKYVIDKPLEELNEKTSLHIIIEKVKRGREVYIIRFHCKEKNEKIAIKKTDSPEEKQNKLSINDDEQFITSHQKRFDELLAEEKSQNTMPFIKDVECFARANAVLRLKAELEEAKKRGKKNGDD
jgi:plasmid replication initiation protein